jgi:hypothetical protein
MGANRPPFEGVEYRLGSSIMKTAFPKKIPSRNMSELGKSLPVLLQAYVRAECDGSGACRKITPESSRYGYFLNASRGGSVRFQFHGAWSFL